MRRKKQGETSSLDIFYSSDSKILIDKEKLFENPRGALQKFILLLEQEYQLSKDDVIDILNEDSDSIPVSIFKNSKLTVLESTVKFLRENQSFTFEKIGEKLNRAPTTISTTYERAHNKVKNQFKLDTCVIYIPVSTLANRKLSILESISIYLKSLGHSNNEISRLLNRDNKTIWTVINRADKKLKHEKK